jgi:hypothetical protein
METYPVPPLTPNPEALAERESIAQIFTDAAELVDDPTPPSPLETHFNRPAWARVAPFDEMQGRLVTNEDFDPFDPKSPVGQNFTFVLTRANDRTEVVVTRQVNGLYRAWVQEPHRRGIPLPHCNGVPDMTVAQVGAFLREVLA